MKARLTLLGAVFAFGLSLVFGAQPANAASGSLTTLSFPTCASWKLSGGTVTLTSSDSAFITITDGNGTEVGSDEFFVAQTVTADTQDYFPVAPARNPIHALFVAGATTLADVTADDPCLPPSTGGTAGFNASGVTFFGAADNRIDPRPADRLGIHCIDPDILHVVAADSSAAVGYAQFKLKDLLAAGQSGLSHPLLSYVTDQPADGGIISAQATHSGGQTYFFVVWNGGKYHATGQGDFTKMFTSPNANCAF